MLVIEEEDFKDTSNNRSDLTQELDCPQPKTPSTPGISDDEEVEILEPHILNTTSSMPWSDMKEFSDLSAKAGLRVHNPRDFDPNDNQYVMKHDANLDPLDYQRVKNRFFNMVRNTKEAAV